MTAPNETPCETCGKPIGQHGLIFYGDDNQPFGATCEACLDEHAATFPALVSWFRQENLGNRAAKAIEELGQ